MSKPAAKKKEETGVFSIEANPFEDGEIPGVTQLLNRNSLASALNQQKKEAPFSLEPTTTGRIQTLSRKIELEPAPGQEEITRSNIAIPQAPAATPSPPSSGTRTNLVIPSSLKLEDFGVLYELRFHPEGQVFRYASLLPHKVSKLFPWQEKIFERMKMDRASLPAVEPFEEFKCGSHPFIFDAFGVDPHHVIQIVSPEYTNARIVLVSDQSIAASAAIIVEHFQKG